MESKIRVFFPNSLGAQALLGKGAFGRETLNSRKGQ